MSYSEAVIVPLEIFQKCKFDTPVDQRKQILCKALPSDVKLKMLQQHMKFNEKAQKKKVAEEKTVDPNEKKVAEESSDMMVNDIVSTIAVKYRPYAESILRKIMASSEISWNDRHEITIDGTLFPASNIFEIMQYLMKSKTVTSHRDVPVGLLETHKKLLELGVPNSWLLAKIPRRTQRVVKPQTGRGLVRWETLP